MRLVLGGVNGLYHREILDNATALTERVDAAVAYATDERLLFDWCWDNEVPLRFWGRFDEAVPVSVLISARVWWASTLFRNAFSRRSSMPRVRIIDPAPQRCTGPPIGSQPTRSGIRTREPGYWTCSRHSGHEIQNGPVSETHRQLVGHLGPDDAIITFN